MNRESGLKGIGELPPVIPPESRREICNPAIKDKNLILIELS
jgi:hypothetical protein